MTGFLLTTPEQRESRLRFVCLVGCGKAKRQGNHKARDLYTGGLTRASIAWADRNCQDWVILSAKYGVLPPNKRVETYELAITDLGKPVREEWGKRVRASLNMLFNGREFLILAGSKYVAALGNLKVLDPLKGLGLFKRTKWLKEYPTLESIQWD